MLASERNLTTAHQSHNQPQRRQNGVRSRNGTAKPAIRPVKIIVIDPRKLQQRLEDYVEEKERKQAEADKLSKNETAESLQAIESKVNELPLPSLRAPVSINNSPPKPLPPSLKAVQTKVLPTLAPKLTAVSGTITAAVNCAVTQAGTVIGNGVAALQCISSANIGLPLVVTNGVALIQPPISQSSIQANGIFLSGITAIPNVITTTSGAYIGPATQVKSKPSTIQRKKVKKRKKAKKRKFSDEDDKEEEAEDAELAYLLKEPTTTRTGRVSKPASQPHSPAFASLPASSVTACPSPIASQTPLKVKKKKARPEVVFRCEICYKVFISQEKLKSHYAEFPHHTAQKILSQSQYPTSTNDQGTLVSVPQLGLRTNLKLSQTPILNSTTTTITSFPPTVSETSCTLQGSISSALPVGEFQSNSANSFISFTGSANSGNAKLNDFFSGARTKSNEYQLSNDSVSNASLVPNSAADEADNLFSHCKSSNVDVVPSSYSIPSSPPSQCQSPGLPENAVDTHRPVKQRSDSPERITCSSPVDPMLLRSRSPFPPHIPDCSLQPVSVSNLSIPEESLCKGELFMDLGDGILENMENSGLSRRNVMSMSISPFCNTSSAPPLYGDSSPTPPKESLLTGQTAEQPPMMEQVTSPISPHVVTPVLIESTEDANDGEIFQTTNYARKFVHPSLSSPIPAVSNANGSVANMMQQKTVSISNGVEFPKTPLSTCLESDASMDSSETIEHVTQNNSDQKRRSVWQFVKEQIKQCGIRQACGEISEMAEKLSRIARDQFIPIREEEIDRMGNSASIIHVDTPFFSHLLDLPFGTYVFKEDAGRRRKVPPPPPVTSSELSFTGGVEDVEKFLPPDIDLISLPHLTNLDLI